jgi:hypothetical protein
LNGEEMKRGFTTFALIAVAVLVVTACGTDDDAESSRGSAADGASPPTSAESEAPRVTVPNVVGLAPGDACEQLEAAGLVCEEAGSEASDDVDEGDVARQVPGSGSSAEEGSTVQVWISEGVDLEAGLPFEWSTGSVGVLFGDYDGETSYSADLRWDIALEEVEIDIEGARPGEANLNPRLRAEFEIVNTTPGRRLDLPAMIHRLALLWEKGSLPPEIERHCTGFANTGAEAGEEYVLRSIDYCSFVMLVFAPVTGDRGTTLDPNGSLVVENSSQREQVLGYSTAIAVDEEEAEQLRDWLLENGPDVGLLFPVSTNRHSAPHWPGTVCFMDHSDPPRPRDYRPVYGAARSDGTVLAENGAHFGSGDGEECTGNPL